jgi:hypothetical protein
MALGHMHVLGISIPGWWPNPVCGMSLPAALHMQRYRLKDRPRHGVCLLVLQWLSCRCPLLPSSGRSLGGASRAQLVSARRAAWRR